ncbi:MAG: hypothetical protein IT341_10670 [Chloroflexi bacterium]|nr:hypothetical protein [Chloroflexota bacterium]
MFASLTRIMPGDAPIGRREGYVALHDVLTIVSDQDRRTAQAIDELKATYRNEAAATRTLVDTYRAETNRRLDALEQWQAAQELEEAFDRGRWYVVMLAFRWFTQHWQVFWGLVALILGVIWTFFGGPAIGVGPVAPQP